MPRTKVTGDFGKIEAWQKLLEETPNLLGIISESAAEETIGLIKDGFRDERDPYGDPWAPKQRPDGRKVLSGKTSRLKGGWHVVKANRRGYSVAPSVDYAAPHQAPKKNRRPRRAMVPYKGLPSDWEKMLEAATVDAMKLHFTTGGGAASGSMGFRFSPVQNRVTAMKRHLNIKALIRKLANAAESD